MRLNIIESNLRLLIYLYTNPDCDLQTIEKNKEIGYSTLHKTLENWRKSKHIAKKRLPQVLGGIKVHYKLSEKGINFLESLLSLLQPILPSSQEDTLKKRVTDLYDKLPEIFNELKIVLDDTQNKMLRNKIKDFLNI